MKKVISVFSLFLFLVGAATLQASHPDSIGVTVPEKQVWVDSVLNSLTPSEKIAQLLMIRTYSNKDQQYYKNTEAIIQTYNIGGLCFFQGGPQRQASLTRRYQQMAKTPMLIALDAEWGLGMRLDSSRSYPFQMTLGALENDTLIYQMGQQIAAQLKSIGTHINFAPVVDVNNNPANPVINSRSFGSNPERVARKGMAYMKGLQDGGIIATAKHFPGHGDTDSDSHYTLPVINHTRQRLDSIELYPFKKLIASELQGVMVAHLFIPALDSTANTPTTLSEKVTRELLKEELGFKGLVITDALDMKGVTSGHKPGEIELKALLAGNDILLLPQDVGAAIKAITDALTQGLITETELNARCRKVLEAKYDMGLYKPVNIRVAEVPDLIHSPENELLEQQLYEGAISVIRNENNVIPLSRFDTLKIAVVSVGAPEITSFQDMLGNYTSVEKFNILSSASPQQRALLIEKLQPFNLVIVGIHGTNIYPTKKFGITDQMLSLVNEIADASNTILTVFASPYSLNLFDSFNRFNGLILAHQDVKAAQNTAAQIIMGSIPANGTLPVPLNAGYDAGWGIKTGSLQRLKYTIPEEVEINRSDLDRIDTIVLQNIRGKAMPGCQVLVAVDGKVIYHKAFGYHTYKKGEFVKTTDLYDVASITKVAATTLSVMKLSDNRKLDIDQKLVNYLPYLGESNKENMVIRELMAHQARLKPWIPFYMNTLMDGKPSPLLYATQPSDKHTLKVAGNLYLDPDYRYAMIDTIIQSELRKKREYKYSDLGFILLSETIRNLTNKPLDRYAAEQFYKPLGLQNTCFNPLSSHKSGTIIPTEEDDYFRHQLIHGYVHDPAAAMMGGVAGHAGLFSTAADLAVIMQMLLQEGYYGGQQYLRPGTVKQFTMQQFPLNDNRRGIGFDKPEPENRKLGPTCEAASLRSFGHTGFTGTYAWADPEYNLVYIFLSNRVNPTAANTKLIKNNTRTEIMKVIYKALKNAGRSPKPADALGQLKPSAASELIKQ